MKRLTRYRIARYGEHFIVQKWFDGRWWYKEGWYTWSYIVASEWVPSRDHFFFRMYTSKEKAEQALGQIVVKSLPNFDIEPVDHLDDYGEELRKIAISGGEKEKLIYADWLDENGFSNNAARIRIWIATTKLAAQETVNAR